MIDAVAAHRKAGSGTGPSPVRWAAAGLMLVEAATFLLASALHRGVQIPLSFTTLVEPMIGPAAIVETTCGLALFIAAITVLAGSRWGWLATVGAHLLSAGGVVLGIVALNAGRGPRTASNDAYHLAILTALVIGLVLLATPPVRTALSRRHWR
jgi:hypothetical protein